MSITDQIRIACIVGARPNFMKMAPILQAFGRVSRIKARLIHTGQHYDVSMNEVFFQQLGLPAPDLNLEIGSGTQTVQTAQIMMGLEQAFEAERPDLVLVVGDVNSTVAAALVSSKMRIALAHVEAGLRSFDMDMPEEVNRLVTDRLSDLLLTTERAAGPQLESEGVAPEKVHFVGNVMIDTLLANLDKAIPAIETVAAHRSDFGDTLAQGYALVTLHRPSNVDDPVQLHGLLEVLRKISATLPLVFTMHPRTKARITENGLSDLLEAPEILTVPPLSYFQMQGMMKNATVVITDSGGLQEETTALGVPCLTVRDNTERPITITEGTNILVGSSPDALYAEMTKLMKGKSKKGRVPELWDGKAAERITQVILRYFEARED